MQRRSRQQRRLYIKHVGGTSNRICATASKFEREILINGRRCSRSFELGEYVSPAREVNYRVAQKCRIVPTSYPRVSEDDVTVKR